MAQVTSVGSGAPEPEDAEAHQLAAFRPFNTAPRSS